MRENLLLSAQSSCWGNRRYECSVPGQGSGSCGINLYYKSTVGDNWVRIVETLSRALSRSDLVIISGGLGPTEERLDQGSGGRGGQPPLGTDEEALEAIEAYFRRRYGEGQMPPNNRKQAYLPRGASAIPNHWGTAPGFILELPVKPLLPCLGCLQN